MFLPLSMFLGNVSPAQFCGRQCFVFAADTVQLILEVHLPLSADKTDRQHFMRIICKLFYKCSLTIGMKISAGKKHWFALRTSLLSNVGRTVMFKRRLCPAKKSTQTTFKVLLGIALDPYSQMPWSDRYNPIWYKTRRYWYLIKNITDSPPAPVLTVGEMLDLLNSMSQVTISVFLCQYAFQGVNS